MGIPELEIEKKLDELETEIGLTLARHEDAIGAMASWLVEAQTGFSARDAHGIENILRGEEPARGNPLGTRSRTVAKILHDTFDKHVAEFGETQRVSAARPWANIPEKERNLWIAVVHELLEKGTIK